MLFCVLTMMKNSIQQLILNVKQLSLAFVLCSVQLLQAQIETKQEPISFQRKEMQKSAREIDLLEMAAVDVKHLLKEDKQQEDKQQAGALPYRFGKEIEVDVSLQNAGTWQTLSSGDRVWRLKIRSSGALSINLIYTSFFMPEGATFHIYNEAKTHVIGAFTSENNKPGKGFATGLVKGEACILEYFEPFIHQNEGIINISQVIHGYRDAFKQAGSQRKTGYGASDGCDNNVNCAVGNDWQDEKRSVAQIVLGGNACTGALINNTNEDKTPYFLTANHCYRGAVSVVSWVFYFNYESPTCANENVPKNQSITGASLRARAVDTDFCLLELSRMPPDSYDVYYAGWSRVTTGITRTVGIHHPQLDIKKISFSNTAPTFINGSRVASVSSFYGWKASWDDGTTEAGSSGSPLFDQNGRIIGQLIGGNSRCVAPTRERGNSKYGALSESWSRSSPSASRLQDWLDPADTDPTTLNGIDGVVAPSITIRYASLSYSATEGSSVTVGVHLSAAPVRDIRIPITVSRHGGASSIDYSTPSSIRFTGMQTFQSFTVSASGDIYNDDGESITLNFGRLPRGILQEAPSSTTIILLDTDVGPSTPTELMATPISYEQINLAWGVPASDGGLAVLAYNIEVSTDGADFVNENNGSVAPVEDADVVMRAGEVMACGRVFLDPGGDRDYGNHQDITMTLVPSFADFKVRVEFTSFRTESRDDNLSIYDGATTADAQLIGKYSGSTLPLVITSTSLDGKLTFRFTSDYNNLYSGWSAIVTCIPSLTSSLNYVHTGLRPETTYYYRVSAINSSGKGAFSQISATTPPLPNCVGKDFPTLSAAGNTGLGGTCSDGTTLWVADYDDDKIYGYNIATKLRDSDKDLSLMDDNGEPEGIWSNERTLWVADGGDDKLYGYDIITKLRTSDKDFDLAVGNDDPRGIWSDGTTLWVADDGNDKIYGYKLSDKSRDSGKDFELAVGNDAPRGIWSDESTLWVADAGNDIVYAYKLSDKSRDSGKDLDLAVFNDDPRGIWSDGTTLWVADDGNDKIYAYSEGDCFAPVFEAPSVRNQEYTLGEAITPVVLPAATDEVSITEASLNYELSGLLPTGLAFQKSTRTLSGTPTNVQSATEYSYTATDEAGNTSARLTFTISVLDTTAPSFEAVVIMNQVYTQGQAITEVVLPAATDVVSTTDSSLTYQLSGLPLGLAFQESTRRLSGTPINVQRATEYSYTATDEAGNRSVELTFTISVIDVPSAPTELIATLISHEQINLAWDVPASDGGLDVLAYNIEVSTDGTDFVNVNKESVAPAPVEGGDVVMRAGEVITCSGVFLDPGGDRDYANYQNITMTLIPAFAGSKVSVEFTSFHTESRFDNLSIYDGATATQFIGGYSGSELPPTITSTSLDGKLTFRFTSNYDGIGAGWSAIITCIPSSLNYVHTGLRPETTYYYRVAAINSSGKGAFSQISATTPVLPNCVGKDFPTLSAAGNTRLGGIWSDGITLWVVDYDDDKLYGYNIATKLRDSGKDLSLFDDNGEPEGIWSDERTLWVADDGDDKLYGYDIITKLRDSGKDFDLAVGNDAPRGIWSDDITLWVADDGNDKIYGYKLSDKSRDLGKDFDLAVGNDSPRGIWSDESTLWVADAGSDKIYAYKLSDKSRDLGKDFDLTDGNDAPRGIWSDGTTLWVADDGNDKIYAYSEGDCLAPVFEKPSVRNQEYTLGEVITPVVLPVAVDDVSSSSGIIYVFNAENLPEGLVYTSGRITGRPTSEEEETTLIYTATDAARNTAMLTFTIVNVFAMRDGERRGCSGFFLDSGRNRDYGYNEDITMTLVPSVSGLKMQVAFTSFEIENRWDYLNIYHGERAIPSQQEGGYTGTVSPETITSESAGGQLTFEFTSDAFTVKSGWLATVSCVAGSEDTTAPGFGDLGIANQVYTQGEKIAPVVLPAATDVVSTTEVSLTYQLSGLPTGLTFEESTRTLSGMPENVQPATEYSYTATDEAGNTSVGLTFTISVLDTTAPSFGAGITDKVYTQGEAITPVVLPVATDAGSTTDLSLNYRLSGLPFGLTFQESTRTLSGTPTNVQTAIRYSYTATDEAGNRSAELTFTIRVIDAPSTPRELMATAQTATTIEIVWMQVAGLTYEVSKNNGTDYTSVGATNMHIFTELMSNTEYMIKIKASNEAGSAENAVITARTAPSVPDGLRSTAETATTIAIAWTQVADLTYEVSKNNDADYTDVGATNMHTFTELSPETEYTIKIKASNAVGSAESEGIMHSTEALASPTVTITEGSSVTVGEGEMTTLTATGSTGNTYAWVCTGIPPATLANADQTALTFTAPMVDANVQYTCVVTATGDGTHALSTTTTASATVTVTNTDTTDPILDPTSSALISDRTFTLTVGIPIEVPLRLPEATDEGAVIYSLAPALPVGLSFNVNTRVISGTPVAMQDAITYTYTASDAVGNTASLTFMIAIEATPLGIVDQPAGFGLYPNPSSNLLILWIKNDFRGMLRICVRDLSGKEVVSFTKEKRTPRLEIPIDLDESGIFLVEVQAGKQVWLEKVVRDE